jgi:hypothetical protein
MNYVSSLPPCTCDALVHALFRASLSGFASCTAVGPSFCLAESLGRLIVCLVASDSGAILVLIRNSAGVFWKLHQYDDAVAPEQLFYRLVVCHTKVICGT